MKKMKFQNDFENSRNYLDSFLRVLKKTRQS